MAAPRYIVSRIGLPEYRTIVSSDAASDRSLALTAFQRPEWIEAWNEEIAPGTASEVILLAAREAQSGALALILPLARSRERSLTVLEGVDQGVTDYNAPVLGPAAPTDAAGAAVLWQALTAAMPRSDLIRLVKMPAQIGARSNPLALLPGLLPSKLHGNVVSIEGSFAEHLRRSDRKLRKEYERYLRRSEEAGGVRIRRVSSHAEAVMIMTALEASQHARIAQSGRSYVLDQQHYARFYRKLVESRAGGTGDQADFADLFYLEHAGAPAAFLYGLHHAGQFFLVRISHVAGEHESFSPGRIMIGETFRALLDLGVRSFDLTIGDYLSKRIFSPTPVPLVELHQSLSFAGGIMTGVERLKHELRQRPRVLAAVNRLRGHAVKA